MCAWADKASYKESLEVYAGALPGPLASWTAWQWRRAAVKRLGVEAAEGAEGVYAACAEAYDALEARLGDSATFFDPAEHRTFDALAYAHLAFHLRSPVAEAAGLTFELVKRPGLVKYVEALAAGALAGGADEAAPAMPDAPAPRPRRAGASGSGGSATAPRRKLSAKEERFRRHTRYALIFAAASVVTYVLMGELIELDFAIDGDDDDDDEDDE